MAREFRLISGEGTITPGGLYTAPATPAPEIVVGLFDGAELVDSNTFRVSLPSAMTGLVNGALSTGGGRRTVEWATDQSGDTILNQLVPPSLLADPSAPGYLVEISLISALPSTYPDPPVASINNHVLRLNIANSDTIRGEGQDHVRVDLSEAFENTGTLVFDAVIGGTAYTASIRAKGAGSISDNTEPYAWNLTEAENLAAYDMVNAAYARRVQQGFRFRWNAEDTITLTFLPDSALGTPAGTIDNKIAEIREDATHQYRLSGVVGGLPNYLPETDGILITQDGILVPAEVSMTGAADSETIGVYVGGTRVDGDSFRVVAVAEQGRITNKISELYAHQEHAYAAAGVAGGSVTYTVLSGPGRFIGVTYGPGFTDFSEVTVPQTVVIAQNVGGVQTDTDTFTLFPTVARIGNKIDRIGLNEGYRFLPARNRPAGTITWRVPGAGSVTTAGTIDATTGDYTSPATADTTDTTDRVEMLLDGTVVDFDDFTIPGSAKRLSVRITNHIDHLLAGGTHTFEAVVTSHNVTGDRTVTWQELYNEALFGAVVADSGNELHGVYTAPADAGGGQGFPMGVEVIIDQDGQTTSAKSEFWVTPTNKIDPPTVEAFVTQDDPRVIVFDPQLSYGFRTGYEVKLQRLTGTTWADVGSVVSITRSFVGQHGAGRSFPNQGAGTYRGAARSVSATMADNSEWVFTESVIVTQDFPDRIPGPPPKPTIRRVGDNLVIDYQNPDDDGGTHLVRARIEVYRDGTTLTSRKGSAAVGVRLGRQKTFFNFAIFTGTYRARVSWDNANSADSGDARQWSAMSDPLVVA